MSVHVGSRQKTNGVIVDNAYSIRMKRKSKKAYPMALLQLVFLILGVVMPLYCLITSMEIEVDHKRLILCIIAFSLIFWGASQFKKLSYTLIPCLIFAVFLFIYEHTAQLIQGFYHMENYVIKHMRHYFGKNYSYYIVEHKKGVYEVTLLFIIASFLVAGVLAYLIETGYLKSLYLLLAVGGIVGPCLVGKLPNPYVLVTHVVIMIGVLGSASVRRGESNHKLRAGRRHLGQTGIYVGAMCMLISMAILVLLSFIITKRRYESIPIPEVKQSVQRQMVSVVKKYTNKSIRAQEQGGDSRVGGLAGGQLNTKLGVITYQHTPQLRITMIKPDGSLYLKGFIGVNYEKDKWTGATKNQRKKYKNLLGRFEDGSYSNEELSVLSAYTMASGSKFEKIAILPSDINIKYINANEQFLYHPYYVGLSPFILGMDAYDYDALSYSEEGIYTDMPNQSYNLRYYNVQLPLQEITKVQDYFWSGSNELDSRLLEGDPAETMTIDWERLRAEELEYREYVHKTYLSLPSDGLDRLLSEFAGYKKDEFNESEGPVNIQKAVLFVRDYLNHAADYTLAPGPLPEGEDFIEYFVYKNHLGYCAHYASAAVIMLRALGVPARYVEGYYVSADTINAGRVVPHENEAIAGKAAVITSGKVQKEVRPVVEVNVDDSCAHAWVEVYIDGYGWYPLELSEGGRGGWNSAAEDRVEPVEPTKPAPTVKPKEQTEEPTEKPTKEPVKQPAKESEVQRAKKNSAANSIAYDIGRWIMIAAVIVTVLTAVHMYRLWIWRKYFRQHNYSQIYLTWYEMLEKYDGYGAGSDVLQQMFTKDAWDHREERYHGLDFAECTRLRELYLMALYSGRVMDKAEFIQARKILKRWYQALNASEVYAVRLWRKYFVTIYFS